MQEVELAQGECSHPPLHGAHFFYSDIAKDDDDVTSYLDSSIRPKWVEKTLETVGNLVGNPLDPRRNRS